MSPFGNLPDVEDKPSERNLSDDDIRWLVLWVTQLAKRYMSNEELPESITSAVESLHTLALGLWREGKLANSKENSIIALETIRRTLLRREVLTALKKSAESDRTVELVRSAFAEADFDFTNEHANALRSYLEAKSRNLQGIPALEAVASRLSSSPAFGVTTLRRANTTLNQVFGTDYAKHHPEHLAAFLIEHELRFDSDFDLIRFFADDIMQVRELRYSSSNLDDSETPRTEDRGGPKRRQAHQLSFSDADAVKRSRGKLGALRSMTTRQLADLYADDRNQFNALLTSSISELLAGKLIDAMIEDDVAERAEKPPDEQVDLKPWIARKVAELRENDPEQLKDMQKRFADEIKELRKNNPAQLEGKLVQILQEHLSNESSDPTE